MGSSSTLSSVLLVLFCYVELGRCYPPAQSPLRDVKPSAPISRPRGLQEVFQIYAPVLTPIGPLAEGKLLDEAYDWDDDESGEVTDYGYDAVDVKEDKHYDSFQVKRDQECKVVLMEHSFGFSYGHPFVGPYMPPLCDFNQVVLNLTVTSRGRQFDRLASLYLGDIEIFRTSTAEPTADGIRWTYTKDVSSYLALFKISQKIIFDLGNLINEKYTAPFNVTLTALFFNETVSAEAAHLILPISARRSEQDKPSAFSLPDDRARNKIKFPNNARRAVVSVLATGQATEEFWYGNVFNSDADPSPPAPEPLPRFSPFREVQLWINGSLAGVVSPYPVIFTGGFCPVLWRPVVGIDAFDLRAGEIDITPWLPLLCATVDEQYDFEIRVVGLDDDGKGNATISDSVGSYWVVTGSIFIWADKDYTWTGGLRLNYSAPEPTIELRSYKYSNVLTYGLIVHRQFSITSQVWTAEGQYLSTWTQNIRCAISGFLALDGDHQTIRLDTDGFDASSDGYTAKYRYEADVQVEAIPDQKKGGTYFEGLIDRSLSLQLHGPSVQSIASARGPSNAPLLKSNSPFSSVELKTRQGGDFTMEISRGNISFAAAETDQGLRFFSIDASPDQSKTSQRAHSKVEMYGRHVLAHNGVLLRDEENLEGHISTDWTSPSSRKDVMGGELVAFETDEVLGRFPPTMRMASRLAAPASSEPESREEAGGWMTGWRAWLRWG